MSAARRAITHAPALNWKLGAIEAAIDLDQERLHQENLEILQEEHHHI